MSAAQPITPILGIDCATPPSSVALVGGESDVEYLTGPFGRGADAWIVGAVDELLRTAGVRLAQLAAIAVSVGPGTFTGVRVGLATAAGLGRGAGIDVVGVGTLDGLIESALHAAGRPPDRSALACIDARRGELYVAMAAAGNPSPHAPVELVWGPTLASADDLVERLRGQPVPLATGTGLALDPRLPERVDQAAAPPPLAASVARLAARTLAHGAAAGVLPATPFYLRPPDARPGKNPLES